MADLVIILAASVIVSLVSLAGIIFLASRKILEQNLHLIVAFSAGALLSTAFFSLFPEALELTDDSHWVFASALIGILLFFIIEKFVHWHHHHNEKHVHPMTYMNLIGDAVHNFADGIVIAASFLVSIPTGVSSTIAIIAHEVPQELGDFGLLVYGGFSRKKALFLNFLSSLASIAGALVAFFAPFFIQGILPLMLGFAAGNFIYIANSDIVPEMHREKDFRKAFFQIIFFVLGILAILGLSFLSH